MRAGVCADVPEALSALTADRLRFALIMDTPAFSEALFPVLLRLSSPCRPQVPMSISEFVGCSLRLFSKNISRDPCSLCFCIIIANRHSENAS
jgi:hypothetical protein